MLGFFRSEAGSTPAFTIRDHWERAQPDGMRPNLTLRFAERISATQNLSGHPISSFAHIIVDVQKEFCDPDCIESLGNADTDRTANNIIAFNSALQKFDIPTFWVYYDVENEGPDKACGGFYKVAPDQDSLIRKASTNAFFGTGLYTKLKSQGINNVIVSGFNLTACVRDTLLGARLYELNSWLVADCTANDENCHEPKSDDWYGRISGLEKSGVTITSAKHVLDAMARKSHSPALTKN